ncbi:hypothetical protein EFY79_00085 [Hanamia caeni]|jgi:hypothetical protein|uniref:Outer membrane protein beta-barrel domain-containing protein n=1 Tax=Hanamia caeni TaxID=2294116 RepID=A0A3M9NRD5_9BACT|nr:hypothetical protein [Hanamia caeni]RNI39743.1 hypothetical protein EFY79_00085 [Hanamia caeni]
MRKKLSFLIIISLVMVSSLSAQNKKARFQSVNQFAIVGGENHVNTAFQTINGIKFSNWFSGIGVGIDNYRYKTLPLFADARWHFGEDKKAFFYGDLGYNFPMKNKPGKEVYYYNTYDFSGDIYTDLGIGFQLSLNKYSSLIFSLGHSYKKLQNKIGIKTPCPVGTCPVDYSRYDYKFGRMILKAGLVF